VSRQSGAAGGETPDVVAISSEALAAIAKAQSPVSYTHLTLPTNREV